MAPSPISLTMRPWCLASSGSMTSARSLRDRGQGAGLVAFDEPRIANDIGGQNRRQAPFGRCRFHQFAAVLHAFRHADQVGKLLQNVLVRADGEAGLAHGFVSDAALPIGPVGVAHPALDGHIGKFRERLRHGSMRLIKPPKFRQENCHCRDSQPGLSCPSAASHASAKPLRIARPCRRRRDRYRRPRAARWG